MLLEKHIDIKSPDLNLIEQLWDNHFLHTRLKFSLILPTCTNASEREKNEQPHFEKRVT